MKLNTLGAQAGKLLSAESDNIQDLRERILRVMTILIVVIGTPMLILNAPQFIQTDNWIFLGFSIFSLIYLIALLIANQGVPYQFRAISIVLVTFGFGALSLENYGLAGDANLWLLFFNIFSTIMLGLRAGFIANFLSLATYILLAS